MSLTWERLSKVPCLFGDSLGLINGFPLPNLNLFFHFSCSLNFYFFIVSRAEEPVCSPSVVALLTAGCHIRGGGPIVTMSLSYVSLYGISIIYCAKTVQSAPSSSLGETAAYVGIDSVCPWKEVVSGCFYIIILDCFSINMLLKQE